MAAQHDVAATELLIGSMGVQFVSDTMANMPPQQAVRTIQNKAGLQHPLCVPLLGMADQLEITRLDAHRGILNAAKQRLLLMVQSMSAGDDKVKLERLLNASFKYLGIQELRDVPVAVMEKLEKVPPVFLKQLTADKQIFKDLPAKVQRQVWEFDKNQLQQDALPPVGQYKYEVATIMRALAMDEFLPAIVRATKAAAAGGKGAGSDGKGPGDGDEDVAGPGPGSNASAAGPRGLPRQGSAGARRPMEPRAVTRKILRKGSYVVQALKGMVGGSPKIYNQIVELCVVKYRDSDSLYVSHKELSYCTLRTQLLMALHDDNNQVASKDRCHELAWTLDAGITNGMLTEKHLQKLEKYFADVQQAEDRQASRQMHGKHAKGKVQDEAESAGNVAGSLVEPYRVLGEASVILRDPSAMHLLSASVLQLLYMCSLDGKLPRDQPLISFVVRMMQLAADGRQMLRDRKYKLPEPDARILHNLLPLMGAWMLEFEAIGSPPPSELVGDAIPGDWGVPKAVVEAAMDVLKRNEVARKLAQTFVLERLLRRDYLSLLRLCKLLSTALGAKAQLEGFDFAGTLAQRLAELVKARQLAPNSLVWRYAVDNILLRTVDSHTQVHEEVLRLLLAASSQLTAVQLGEYLAQTLENSKKSRRRVSKKQAQGGLGPLAEFPMSLGGLGSDIGSDMGSDGWPGILKLKLNASDGVRSVYNLFVRVRDINEGTAPALFAYLAESEQANQVRQAAAADQADAQPGDAGGLRSPGAAAPTPGDAPPSGRGEQSPPDGPAPQAADAPAVEAEAI